MDLTLPDDLRMLSTSAREFVARECPTDRVRRVAGAPDGFDVDLWHAMAALGWTAIAIAADDGGAGGGALELAVLCEALGRGPVPSPLAVSTTLAALPIAWAGSAEQRARWLPALAAGEAVGTMAILEPGGFDEWTTPSMAGGAAVHGVKVLVPWAAVADVLVVATANGLFLVERDSATCAVERHDDLGADALFAVELRGAVAEPLAADGHASVLHRALDHAAVAQLASAVGAAERALELAVQHANDRHQFGRPIGAFQAVAHRCVDMRTDIDACRYLAYRAAWALDERRDGALEVASAVAYGKDALRRVVVHAHQVLGAIGFSTEHDLHLFTRRAKAFELTYGSSARHLERVAVEMGLG